MRIFTWLYHYVYDNLRTFKAIIFCKLGISSYVSGQQNHPTINAHLPSRGGVSHLWKGPGQYISEVTRYSLPITGCVPQRAQSSRMFLDGIIKFYLPFLLLPD